MQQRHPEVNFQCMDIRDLLLPSSLESIGPLESYDLIIDKGTLDALVAEKGSVWDPSEHVRENAKKEIDAVVGYVCLCKDWDGSGSDIYSIQLSHRLLKPGATFLYMTWQQKQFRLMFLERPGQWDVSVQTVQTAGGEGWDYYLFIGKKK